MGKVKGPRFDEGTDLDKWMKLLKSWVRTLPATTTNDEVVAAIIMGLSDTTSKSDALDLVLEIDDDKLYPPIAPPADGTAPIAPPINRSDINSIPGLKEILDVFKDKYGESEEEKAFQSYEAFENLKRDSKS